MHFKHQQPRRIEIKNCLSTRGLPFQSDPTLTLFVLCFQVLDEEKRGYLKSEELTKYMTQEGRRSTFTIYYVRKNR